MKVGTDAVLLGAWCEVGKARRILDIGTGSGILALMMAQRSNPHALIDAVEILPNDAAQAAKNVQDSPWPLKVNVIHCRIQDHTFQDGYDLIVCNPPYFSRSLHPPDQARTTVRHDVMLPQDELLSAVIRLLKPNGTYGLILPPEEGEKFRDQASRKGLYLKRLTRLYAREGKAQERSLMEFTLAPTELITDSLFLYDKGQEKTPAYQVLTSEFYL
jgi:tRNA1Val (adenine37-N6)-methyltransferase